MKKHSFLWATLLAMCCITACKKEVKQTQICLHDSSVNYLKRWAVESIETNVYNVNKELLSHTLTYPEGYFQINDDFSYNLFSDADPVNGKWNINKNCEFVLNPGTDKERDFAVIKLSDDSLTLRETLGGIKVITQSCSAFKCPDLPSLQFRWDNAFTLEAPYGPDTVFKTTYIRQPGYFQLNADASYSLVQSPVNGMPSPPPPLNGTWGIAQPGCLVVLDKRKPNERSFEVQKLTRDSLVIWRKDTMKKVNYLQHYSKHK